LSYSFEKNRIGRLIDNDRNLKEMQRLFLDWDIINNQGGPGTSRNDNGGWHCLCHLVAAGVACIDDNENYGWMEIGYDNRLGGYLPILAFEERGTAQISPLNTQEGRQKAASFKIWAYIEGNSKGRISAKNVIDSPQLTWRRQKYDHSPTDLLNRDGGKVWEHWCTTRDMKDPNGNGVKVLKAYLTLLSLVGGELGATVLRGRGQYGHPTHLRACVSSGLFTKEEATWNITPTEISSAVQRLLYEAEPKMSLQAIKQLARSANKAYFMFKRSIRDWQPPQQY